MSPGGWENLAGQCLGRDWPRPAIRSSIHSGPLSSVPKLQGSFVCSKRHRLAAPAVAASATNACLRTRGCQLVVGRPRERASHHHSHREGVASSEAFRTVQRLARLARIEGQVSPHSLRHAFATIALNEGTSLHDLQDSIGDPALRAGTTGHRTRSRKRLPRRRTGVGLNPSIEMRPLDQSGRGRRSCSAIKAEHGVCGPAPGRQPHRPQVSRKLRVGSEDCLDRR